GLRDLLSFPTRRSSDLAVEPSAVLPVNWLGISFYDAPCVGPFPPNKGTTHTAKFPFVFGALTQPVVRHANFIQPNGSLFINRPRSEEHTSELQSRENPV